MRDARRGDTWMADLGIAAKVRPCLLITDFPADDELALITLIPHTTAVRGNGWEVPLPLRYLETGAFHLQQIPHPSLSPRLCVIGVLPDTDYNVVLDRLAERLSL